MNDTERLRNALVGLGLSESAAAIGAAGRDPVRPAGFDGLVATFRGLGLTESAARVAAVGRGGSESAARVAFDEAARARPVVRTAAQPAKAGRGSRPVRSPAASGAGARKPAGGRVMVSEAAGMPAETEAYLALREAGVRPERAARAAAERAHGPDRRVAALRECLLR